MSSIILNGDSLRIDNGMDKVFVDIGEPDGYQHHAFEISVYPSMAFIAIVKHESEIICRIMVFPERHWFDEWYEGLDNPPKILGYIKHPQGIVS